MRNTTSSRTPHARAICETSRHAPLGTRRNSLSSAASNKLSFRRLNVLVRPIDEMRKFADGLDRNEFVFVEMLQVARRRA